MILLCASWTSVVHVRSLFTGVYNERTSHCLNIGDRFFINRETKRPKKKMGLVYPQRCSFLYTRFARQTHVFDVKPSLALCVKFVLKNLSEWLNMFVCNLYININKEFEMEKIAIFDYCFTCPALFFSNHLRKRRVRGNFLVLRSVVINGGQWRKRKY